jgi:GDPmannose 4,6-dehydratase
LLGDSTKAKNKLNWQPKISFQELVKEMMMADLEEAKKDKLCEEKGFNVYNHHE